MAARTRTVRAQARLRSWCIGELLELAGLGRPARGRRSGGRRRRSGPARRWWCCRPASSRRRPSAGRRWSCPSPRGSAPGRRSRRSTRRRWSPRWRPWPRPSLYSSTRQPTGVARSSTWASSAAASVTPRPLRSETTAWSKVFCRRALASGAARVAMAARRRGRVEDEVAGQRPGVVGRGGDGALLAAGVADPDPVLEPARPDLRWSAAAAGAAAAVPGLAATVGDGVCGGRRGGGRPGRRRPPGSLVMEARPTTSPPRNSTTASSAMVSSAGHAAGPEPPLLGEPVQHPGPLVAARPWPSHPRQRRQGPAYPPDPRRRGARHRGP